MQPAERLVIRSRPLTIALAIGSGVIAAVIGVFVPIGVGANLVSVGVSVLCLALVLVVAVDYPLAVVFSEAGLLRRTLLAPRRLAWSEVAALRRVRERPKALGAQPGRLHYREGGLVADLGRRKLWLCDRIETAEQFRRVRALAESGGVEVLASHPPLA